MKLKKQTLSASQSDLARIIAKEFNVKCTRHDVLRFYSEQGAPQPDPRSKKFNIEAFKNWYRENKMSTAEADHEKKITLVELAKVKLVNAKFDGEFNRGLYIKKTEATMREASRAKQFHAMIKRIETEPARMCHERLRELGLNDQSITAAAAVMRAIGIEIVTAIEPECAKIE